MGATSGSLMPRILYSKEDTVISDLAPVASGAVCAFAAAEASSRVTTIESLNGFMLAILAMLNWKRRRHFTPGDAREQIKIWCNLGFKPWRCYFVCQTTKQWD